MTCYLYGSTQSDFEEKTCYHCGKKVYGWTVKPVNEDAVANIIYVPVCQDCLPKYYKDWEVILHE